jgi:hypothetical protein
LVQYKKLFSHYLILIVSTILLSIQTYHFVSIYGFWYNIKSFSDMDFSQFPSRWTIYMPPKGLTKANKARLKAFEQSHATFADQSATTSTWTRLTGTSSGSVQITTEKVAVGLEPPQKRRRTDEQAQPSFPSESASTSDPSSTPVADSPSPSTSELATDPDGKLAPASKKPTTPIKPYVSVSKPSLSNASLTSHRRANLHFCNSSKTALHHF